MGVQVQAGKQAGDKRQLSVDGIYSLCHRFPENYTGCLQALIIPRSTSRSREPYEREGIWSYPECFSTNPLYPRAEEMGSTESNQLCSPPAVARTKAGLIKPTSLGSSFHGPPSSEISKSSLHRTSQPK